MPKFRKKPVVIEAVQVGPEPAPPWFTAAVERGDIYFEKFAEGVAFINTLEGVMRADRGDWIIQGVKGEIYPCKPDIFEATYEPAGEPIDEPFTTLEEKIHAYMQDPGPAVGDTLREAHIRHAKAWLERTTIDEIDLDDAPEAYAGEMAPSERYTRFRDELEGLVNCHSMENGSDTPDFMLAAFLVDVLNAFDTLMKKRDAWYGASHRRLKAQLEAEGAHTAAANAEIERLKGMLERHITSEPDKGD